MDPKEAGKAIAELLAYQPGKRTVDDLVRGDEHGFGRSFFSASTVRLGLGYLYGQGIAHVVEVRNGVEVWALCQLDERAKR